MTDNRSDVQDLRLYGENLRASIASKLSSAQVSDVRNIAVGGRPAVRFDIAGVANGVRVRFLYTAIEGNSGILKVNAWTLESRFAESRRALEALVAGLTELTSTAQAD